jgi:Zn-dependent peptidase ImmA (M78 family)
VAYEGGRRTPSPQVVERFAKTLNFPVSFFERPELERLQEEAASFRSLSRMKAAQREGALASGELALELNDWLESRFVLPPTDVPDLRPQPDPEAAAIALRTRWGLSDRPITNMVRLLEAKGVRVFSLAEACAEVDAFSLWRGARPFVFLNTVKSAERSRFDAAHELGHLVLHRHGQPNGREAEQECDRFAGAFLMPKSSLLAYAPKLPTIQNLIQAKKYWGVAVSALAYRMHTVGLITDWQYRSLCIEIQRLGYRKAEPERAPRELSQVMEKVFASLREEGVSKASLAELLGWPSRELRTLVFQLVVSTESGGLRESAKTHINIGSSGNHLRLAN